MSVEAEVAAVASKSVPVFPFQSAFLQSGSSIVFLC